MQTKICSKCKIEKDICEFRKSSKSKSGLQSECKSCAKIRYLSNYEEELKKKRLYYQKNKEKKSKYDKDYYEKNRLKKNEYVRNYRKIKRKENPTFKITESVRSRIKSYFRLNNIKNYNKTFDLVGCTPEELRTYLSNKFIEDMCWDNYGEWHIDHIIPLSSAKTEEEIYELCHYTNLQPMWATENIKKSNKLIKT